MSAPRKKKPNPDDELDFCAKCFSTSEGGSWGYGCSEGHCYNCGAGGCTVKLARWAVDSIREQASWVGKRYYPHREDAERCDELEGLRKLVKVFPGRSADRVAGTAHEWQVSQEMPDGSVTSVYLRASSRRDALEKAKTDLPYVGRNKLKGRS